MVVGKAAYLLEL
ncbi:hypothetical protein S40285_10929 [Stachybotrys chlorohalonatus IBT 40285]|uniref:Uncharacterized protein n=1 Tax=Stachybotrys chlorohalonatus (strain IBT 40285) TaxID=1283841 RepID=A0A084QQF5_STAC4|nr:hypothetical protein S40285_10929 [Stachybotrys chlorohalonata IBT 40285]